MAQIPSDVLYNLLLSFSDITDIVGTRIQEAPADEIDVTLGAVTFSTTGGGVKGPSSANTDSILPQQTCEYVIKCWGAGSVESAYALYNAVHDSLTTTARHTVGGVNIGAMRQLGQMLRSEDTVDGAPAVQATFSFEMKT